jgi:hypothetical protein
MEGFVRATDDLIRKSRNDEMVKNIKLLHSVEAKMAICTDNTPFWLKKQLGVGDLQEYFKGNVFSSYDAGCSNRN